MIYEFPIRTLTTHTSDEPLETVLKLTKGVLHQLDIISYPGARGTLYIALYHGGHKVFPTNPLEYFRLAGEPFSFTERYKLATDPFTLVAHTYLYDADNYHDARIRIGLLLEDELSGVILKWSEELPAI
uniref:Uncharacterized protein n=1 Tax=viral metagenome TaxID=1070528 RepID=A0A6M3IEG9_9ZZZZ